MGIGIVGCGDIAGPYAKSIAQHDEIRLVAASTFEQPALMEWVQLATASQA